MDISLESLQAQSQGLLRQEIGTRVLKMASDAEASVALSLVQMMDQNAGLGTNFDIRV